MPQQRKPSADDGKTQRQKFIDAAREHEASEDAGVFRTMVRGVVTAAVKKPKKAPRKRKR